MPLIEELQVSWKDLMPAQRPVRLLNDRRGPVAIISDSLFTKLRLCQNPRPAEIFACFASISIEPPKDDQDTLRPRRPCIVRQRGLSCCRQHQVVHNLKQPPVKKWSYQRKSPPRRTACHFPQNPRRP
jgi:hypothetical protein